MYHLTPRELRCVESLAEHYKTADRIPTYCRVNNIPTENGESNKDIKEIVERLSINGLVSWNGTDSFIIKPSLLDLAHELKHPSPRNYWAEWSNWWLSKRWLVAVSVLVFLAPIIAQWIEWMFAILSFLSND